jgi:hypothetical protein
MLHQEAATEPYFEEEVEEAILPSLNWRAEGRARRPVLVRGWILADEVRSRMHICAWRLLVCTNASLSGVALCRLATGRQPWH